MILTRTLLVDVLSQVYPGCSVRLDHWTERLIRGGGSGAHVRRVQCDLSIDMVSHVQSLIVKDLDTRSAGGFSASTEVAFYASGLSAVFPQSLAAPRCYRAIQRASNVESMCLEDVCTVATSPSSLSDFAAIGRAVGRMNARARGDDYIKGWMKTDLLSSLSGGSADVTLPGVQPFGGMLVPDGTASLLNVIAERRELLIKILKSLPHVICHNDVSSRNAFVRQDEGEPSVRLIDWAHVGPSAVGSELSALVGGTLFLGDQPVTALEDLEAAAIKGYCAGLSDEGWCPGEDSVRSGYAAASALRLLRRAKFLQRLTANPALRAVCEQRLGRSFLELVERFQEMLPHQGALGMAVLQ